MTRLKPSRITCSAALSVAATVFGCALPCSALAQDEGGLYIAGNGFSFEQAANRGLAQNPTGQRFFLLALPPESRSLTPAATRSAAALRDRVTAQGGVFLVCQRDVDSGAVDVTTLVPGVVAVRGFPPPGSNAIPAGERYYPDENRDNLPRSNEALRRIRSTCS
jgi:hypothetical protein